MFIRNGLKFTLASLLAFSLAGCAGSESTADTTAPETDSTQQVETIDILVPSGAPALGVLGAFDQENVNVEIVQGTDVITAELAKTDSEYEIIVAPINVGVNVYRQSPNYSLNGVLTWGNLYLVGQEGSEDETTAAFGENAVPGLVFGNVLPDLAAGAVYYPSVAEAQQALLAGQEKVALLAQPAAAAAIAKGAENDLELSILSDLQSLWQQDHDTDEKGYPQAAVFVRVDGAEGSDEVIAQIASFLQDADDDTLSAAIESVGAEKLGVPNAQIAVKTWAAQNIHYKSAADAREDIVKFLAVFNIELPEDIIQ